MDTSTEYENTVLLMVPLSPKSMSLRGMIDIFELRYHVRLDAGLLYAAARRLVGERADIVELSDHEFTNCEQWERGKFDNLWKATEIMRERRLKVHEWLARARNWALN